MNGGPDPAKRIRSVVEVPALLDKSIPKYNIIMKCDKEIISRIMEPSLSNEFMFKPYSDKDIEKWAKIEMSVGEFETKEAAINRFHKEFIPFGEELYERCWFITDRNNNYIATASALNYKKDNKHWASLNWVAVKPEYQGKGLGKAIVQKALTSCKTCEPNQDVYLKTQTWSHKAIKIYLKFGFNILKNETIAHYKNEYEDAIGVLKKVIDKGMH